MTVTGTGFLANELVEVWLHSTPVKLATIRTSSDGTFSIPVTIPTSTETGAHTIRVLGTTSQLEARTPLIVTQPGLPTTGLNILPLIPLAAALLLAGLVLTWRRLRRARP